MLGYDNRLTKDQEFEKVKKSGTIFQSNNFGLVKLDRKDDSPSRFGFVVSTKISKSAVVRNRIRRILGEGVRHQIVYVKKGYDVVILAKPSAERAYTADLMKEVKEALNSAGLIK